MMEALHGRADPPAQRQDGGGGTEDAFYRASPGVHLRLATLGLPEGSGQLAQDDSSLFQPALNALKVLHRNNKSFYFFSPRNEFRKICGVLVNAPAFGKLVLLLILANCITLAMEPGSCDEACKKSDYIQVLFILDTFFTACFTLEILMQTVTHCFVLGPSAYLRDGWNWIDLLSTATGYISFLPVGDGGGLNGLRALRALRPLRALKAIPGLRRLVQCLMDVVPLLLDVLLLLVWVFLVFGIIALNIFSGTLHKRCAYLQPLPLESPLPLNGSAAGPPAAPPIAGAAAISAASLSARGPMLVAAGLSNASLPPAWPRAPSPASLVRRRTSSGANPATLPVPVGSASPASSASVTAAGGGVATVAPPPLPASPPASPNAGRSADDGGADGGGEWVLVPNLSNQPCSSSGSRGAFTCPSEYQGIAVSCRGGFPNPNFGYTGFDNFGLASLNIFAMLTLDGWTQLQLYPQWNAVGPGLPIAFFSLLVLFGAFFAMQLVVAIMSSKFAQLEAVARSQGPSRTATTANLLQLEDASEDQGLYGIDGDGDAATLGRSQRPGPAARLAITLDALGSRWDDGKRVLLDWAYDIRLRYMQPVHRVMLPPWRRRAHTVVHHGAFRWAMTAAILINTVALGMVHYDMGAKWTRALNIINDVLTYVFIVELVLMHVAIGFMRYWSDLWNVLDGVVVGVSVAEIIMTALGGNNTGTQALRALRVLRVLRSLKLLRRVRGLRQLVKVVLRGFVALGDFLMLSLLFIFIFSVMGLQQFGGLWSFKPEANLDNLDQARSSFDTLWAAGYTVFQILTCDDWLRIAWNGMRGAGDAAVLYFVTWVVIGNFVLLSLFLAILITTFQSGSDETPPRDEDDPDDETGPKESGYGTGGGSDDGVVSSAATVHAGRGSGGHGDGGGGGGGGGNMLQQRVNERASEHLDPARVKIMKRWLVMIGLTHGISDAEVDSIVKELDNRLADDPDSMPRDTSFTTPYFLHRHSVGARRAGTLRRSSVPQHAGHELPSMPEQEVIARASVRRSSPRGASLRRVAATAAAAAAAAAADALGHHGGGNGGDGGGGVLGGDGSSGTGAAVAWINHTHAQNGVGAGTDAVSGAAEGVTVLNRAVDDIPLATPFESAAGAAAAAAAAVAAVAVDEADGAGGDGSNPLYCHASTGSGTRSVALPHAPASAPVGAVLPDYPCGGGGVAGVLGRLADAVRKLASPGGGGGPSPHISGTLPRSSGQVRLDGPPTPAPPYGSPVYGPPGGDASSTGGFHRLSAMFEVPKRLSVPGMGSTCGAAAGASCQLPPHSHHALHGPSRMQARRRVPLQQRGDSWSMLLQLNDAQLQRRQHQVQREHRRRQELKELWAEQRLQSWLLDSQAALRGQSDKGTGDGMYGSTKAERGPDAHPDGTPPLTAVAAMTGGQAVVKDGRRISGVNESESVLLLHSSDALIAADSDKVALAEAGVLVGGAGTAADGDDDSDDGGGCKLHSHQLRPRPHPVAQALESHGAGIGPRCGRSHSMPYNWGAGPLCGVQPTDIGTAEGTTQFRCGEAVAAPEAWWPPLRHAWWSAPSDAQHALPVLVAAAAQLAADLGKQGGGGRGEVRGMTLGRRLEGGSRGSSESLVSAAARSATQASRAADVSRAGDALTTRPSVPPGSYDGALAITVAEPEVPGMRRDGREPGNLPLQEPGKSRDTATTATQRCADNRPSATAAAAPSAAGGRWLGPPPLHISGGAAAAHGDARAVAVADGTSKPAGTGSGPAGWTTCSVTSPGAAAGSAAALALPPTSTLHNPPEMIPLEAPAGDAPADHDPDLGGAEQLSTFEDPPAPKLPPNALPPTDAGAVARSRSSRRRLLGGGSTRGASLTPSLAVSLLTPPPESVPEQGAAGRHTTSAAAPLPPGGDSDDRSSETSIDCLDSPNSATLNGLALAMNRFMWGPPPEPLQGAVITNIGLSDSSLSSGGSRGNGSGLEGDNHGDGALLSPPGETPGLLASVSRPLSDDRSSDQLPPDLVIGLSPAPAPPGGPPRSGSGLDEGRQRGGLAVQDGKGRSDAEAGNRSQRRRRNSHLTGTCGSIAGGDGDGGGAADADDDNGGRISGSFLRPRRPRLSSTINPFYDCGSQALGSLGERFGGGVRSGGGSVNGKSDPSEPLIQCLFGMNGIYGNPLASRSRSGSTTGMRPQLPSNVNGELLETTGSMASAVEPATGASTAAAPTATAAEVATRALPVAATANLGPEGRTAACAIADMGPSDGAPPPDTPVTALAMARQAGSGQASGPVRDVGSDASSACTRGLLLAPPPTGPAAAGMLTYDDAHQGVKGDASITIGWESISSTTGSWLGHNAPAEARANAAMAGKAAIALGGAPTSDAKGGGASDTTLGQITAARSTAAGLQMRTAAATAAALGMTTSVRPNAPTPQAGSARRQPSRSLPSHDGTSTVHATGGAVASNSGAASPWPNTRHQAGPVAEGLELNGAFEPFGAGACSAIACHGHGAGGPQPLVVRRALATNAQVRTSVGGDVAATDASAGARSEHYCGGVNLNGAANAASAWPSPGPASPRGSGGCDGVFPLSKMTLRPIRSLMRRSNQQHASTGAEGDGNSGDEDCQLRSRQVRGGGACGSYNRRHNSRGNGHARSCGYIPCAPPGPLCESSLASAGSGDGGSENGGRGGAQPSSSRNALAHAPTQSAVEIAPSSSVDVPMPRQDRHAVGSSASADYAATLATAVAVIAPPPQAGSPLGNPDPPGSSNMEAALRPSSTGTGTMPASGSKSRLASSSGVEPPQPPNPQLVARRPPRLLLHSASTKHRGPTPLSPGAATSVTATKGRFSGPGESPSQVTGSGTSVWTARNVAWARAHGPRDAIEMEEALFGPQRIPTSLSRPRDLRTQPMLMHVSSATTRTSAAPASAAPAPNNASGRNARQLLGVGPGGDEEQRRIVPSAVAANVMKQSAPQVAIPEVDGDTAGEADAGATPALASGVDASGNGAGNRAGRGDGSDDGCDGGGGDDGGLGVMQQAGEEPEGDDVPHYMEPWYDDEEVPDPAPYLDYPAFCCLSGTSTVRQLAAVLITNRWFDYTILAIIVASSAILALDSPRLDTDSPLGKAVAIMDIVFTAIFTAEMAIKMVAKGVLLHPHAYLRNGWDQLDFLIVVTSLLSLALQNSGGSETLMSVRLVRTLRPLRLIRRLRGMRLVVETLIGSLPTLSNVALFGVFQFTLFGILGVQLFAGAFSVCSQTAINGVAVTKKSQCVEGVSYICTPDDLCPNPGEPAVRWWGPPMRNFNNLGWAMLTLFTVVTLDGYMEVMRSCIDVVGVDRVPEFNHAPYMGLYILVFVFLGSFFWVNLLVSKVVDHYNQVVLQDGDLLTTKQTKEFIRIFKIEGPRNVWTGGCPKDASRFRRFCWKVASNRRFDVAVTVNIIVNIIAMAAVYYGNSRQYEVALALVNVACTAGFAVEAVLKIVALGFRKYIRDNWNKLDLFIVFTSIPDIVSIFAPRLAGTGIVTVLRLLRVLRLFKLIRKAKGLRTLFNTLISSLPAIANVGSLLLLVMYIYAVIGMNLYGDEGSAFDQPGSHATYNNIGVAMITQFRLFTGDGWGDLMALAMGCDDDQYQCDTGGGALVAALFFCSFVLVAIFVMLNLVIAVVVDNFIDNAQLEGLLKTSKFVDILKMVITLRVFVKLMRRKIDMMAKHQRALMLTSASQNGRQSTSRRTRSRGSGGLSLSGTTPSGGGAGGAGGGGKVSGSLSRRGSAPEDAFLPRFLETMSQLRGSGMQRLSSLLPRTETSVGTGSGGGGEAGGSAAATMVPSMPPSALRQSGGPATHALLATIRPVLPRNQDSPLLLAGQRTALYTQSSGFDADANDGGPAAAAADTPIAYRQMPGAAGCAGGALGFGDLREQVLRGHRRRTLLALHKHRVKASGGPTGNGIDCGGLSLSPNSGAARAASGSGASGAATSTTPNRRSFASELSGVPAEAGGKGGVGGAAEQIFRERGASAGGPRSGSPHAVRPAASEPERPGLSGLLEHLFRRRNVTQSTSPSASSVAPGNADSSRVNRDDCCGLEPSPGSDPNFSAGVAPDRAGSASTLTLRHHQPLGELAVPLARPQQRQQHQQPDSSTAFGLPQDYRASGAVLPVDGPTAAMAVRKGPSTNRCTAAAGSSAGCTAATGSGSPPSIGAAAGDTTAVVAELPPSLWTAGHAGAAASGAWTSGVGGSGIGGTVRRRVAAGTTIPAPPPPPPPPPPAPPPALASASTRQRAECRLLLEEHMGAEAVAYEQC